MIARALVLSVIVVGCAAQPPRPASQNPSPMVERTRTHPRLDPADSARGQRFVIDDVLSSPIRVFVPDRDTAGRDVLLIHFLGAPFIAERAAASSERNYIAAVVNLGAGSAVYERPFTDPLVFGRLVDAVARVTQREFDAIVLSGFSAGYGAIRAILRDSASASRIEGIVLLDGLHTSYIPERVVLHEGGRLDTTLLEPFVEYARRAAAGRARFIMTHSEIFPGTFASTTETSDHVMESLGLARTPVLEWGPGGMQLLSSTRAGGLSILGFAGNTAPDHIDHLHALPDILAAYDRLTPAAR